MTPIRRVFVSTGLCWLWFLCATARAEPPLQPHPDNPHYFLFRGKPTVLIGSSEHYGAVLNLDFDYIRYLNAIQADGLDVTRIFTGTYRELPGPFAPGFDFEIVGNTLAPAPGRLLAPWRQTHVVGADGQRKYDLDQWNEVYFQRLKDFIREAGRRGIIVEVSLFGTYYADNFWNASPMNVRNNVNGVGDVSKEDVLSVKDGRLVAVQESLVRKIVGELRGFDNIYYEICNEPYLGPVQSEWQARMARAIVDSEAVQSTRHMIAQEISITPESIVNPVPGISLFLFHGTRTPEGVTLNYVLGKPLGSNENGFDGIADAPYRIQSWQFLFAGGALAMGLDYSFTVQHPDGSFSLPATQPGGGSRALRSQLGILHRLMNDIHFLKMTPMPSLIKSSLPEHTSAYALADTGKEYAIYIHHGRELTAKTYSDPQYTVDSTSRTIHIALDLPPCAYTVQWVHPKSGKSEKQVATVVGTGLTELTSPTYSEDIALRITRK